MLVKSGANYYRFLPISEKFMTKVIGDKRLIHLDPFEQCKSIIGDERGIIITVFDEKIWVE